MNGKMDCNTVFTAFFEVINLIKKEQGRWNQNGQL